MSTRRLVPLFVVAVAFLLAANAFGQSIVSARSGAIHHVMGRALIDGDVVETKFAEFPNLRPGSILETEAGRVEMLLTPGAVFRMSEDSAVKMISDRLSDTRLEVTEGSAMIEVMEILEGNAVTVVLNDTIIQPLKKGIYRIDADPAQLRVYDGKAQITRGDEVLIAKKGKVVELGAFLVATKFDPKTGDPLYRWSARRSSYLSMANLYAARSISEWGVPWSRGGWRWNPYMGMFTFIPVGGILRSPFGYSYWSPTRVYVAYVPPRTIGSGGGGGGFASTGRGSYSPRLGYSVGSSRPTYGSSGSSSTSTSGSSVSSGRPSGGTSSPRGGGSRGR